MPLARLLAFGTLSFNSFNFLSANVAPFRSCGSYNLVQNETRKRYRKRRLSSKTFGSDRVARFSSRSWAHECKIIKESCRMGVPTQCSTRAFCMRGTGVGRGRHGQRGTLSEPSTLPGSDVILQRAPTLCTEHSAVACRTPTTNTSAFTATWSAEKVSPNVIQVSFSLTQTGLLHSL